jgi:hypothetical protein
MYENDSELRDLLDATEMDAQPDPARVQAVRDRMMNIASRTGRRSHGRRNVLVAALVVLGVSGIGLAATETGRDFIRWIFTPVEEIQTTKWVSPDGSVWSHSRTGRSEPFSPEETEAITRTFAENYEIQEAGGGRLIGLMEGPGFDGAISHTTYSIEYTQSDGQKNQVGSGRPTGKQAENMRIDEIMRLRDAGTGEIIEERPSRIGLGRYTIRFTLSDGEMIDLETFHPPSTREQREQIFAEMHELKTQLRFTVENPHVYPGDPTGGVWGLLRYTLCDGRTVGAVERVPPEAISEDGLYVVLPDWESPIAIEGASATPD